MTTTQFNLALRQLSFKGRLCKKLMAAAPDDLLEKVVAHIVRKRDPVVADLIPREPHPFCGYDTMTDWLAAMGYLYRTKGRQYTFIHTSAHSIV